MTTRRRRTGLAIGLMLLVAALASRVEITHPRVHVRWRAGVGDQLRSTLERRFDLREGTPVAETPTTWQYRLGTLSRSNIQALIDEQAVEDTAYIDRAELTTQGREYRVRWYPYSDLVDAPSQLLRLHPSVWLLLAGGSVLLMARSPSASRRRNTTVAALMFVGVMAVALPIDPSVVTMGGSEGRARSREDFEFFYAGRVRFEKHLSQVLLLQFYQRDETDASPQRALVAVSRVGTAWFLLSALAVGVVERWSPLALRYLGTVMLAPSAILYFGWREFGYLSLSAVAFPLFVRGLKDLSMRLEAGSAVAGLGAALHGTGLVSLAGAGLAAVTSPGPLMDRFRRVVRFAAWGTAAYLGWVLVYELVLGLPISPDPAPAAFSSWRPWTVAEVRGGRLSSPLWSATTARDLAMTAWVVGAPLFFVAGSLWRRHTHDMRAALWYAVPSILFVVFRWPYDGVGGGMDLIVAGFPAIYALVWVCAHDPKRTAVAAALLASAHYAFWRVVLDKSFIPLP